MLPPITAHECPFRYSGAWLAHWEYLFETALSGLDTTTVTGRQWFNRFTAAKTLVTQTITKDLDQGLHLAESVLLHTVGGHANETEITGAWFDLKREAGRLVTLALPTAEERHALLVGEVADLIEERRMAYASAALSEARSLGTAEIEDRNQGLWLAIQGRAA